ncbi:MAG: TonB-dependent receptor [Woeseiaceae bacterium]|nr:TonB-dependent receptor [Woeseiaceae bacterium]
MNSITRNPILILGVTSLAAFSQGYAAIDEIVVTAAPAEDRVSPPSLVLDHDALQEFQPIATADVFRNVTGISLRTNSRGESVIRIRGAEERQTLVFLDGAPLATPWDGRADLALLPAGLIDRLEVKRGVVPIEYGANAVAGAVDLFTLVPDSGTTVRAEAQQGSLGSSNFNALAGVGLDNGWSFVGGASSIERDAERIADRSSVAFDPSLNSERTNTDLSGNSMYLATAYSGETHFLRASLLHADVERGVAAMGNLDPSVSNPRFWRVPDWHLTQATLNGSWKLSDRADLRVTGWRQWFDQTIDAYTDYSYTALDAREEGADDTVGARVTLAIESDRATVRLVSTAQESTHDQIESTTTTGDASDFVATPELRYRQRLFTIGAEADIPLGETLTSTFGLARDRAVTPLTGDKPSQPSLSATGWSAGLRWTPAEKWELAATVGERTRFPTPRELYGASLGRFLLNPELKPERSLLSDVNLKILPSDSLSLDFAVWANRSDDTLSQRNVQVDGVSRRQRFNTNGSFTYGVEAAATWYLTDNFRTEFSAALQDGSVERDENGERPVLLQRPDAQVRVALDWQANRRLDLRAEFMHTGESYDLEDNGTVATLPDANTINLRGFFQIAEWRGREIQVTASVDNLTDELVLPQLGLPAPGRMYRIGVRID